MLLRIFIAYFRYRYRAYSGSDFKSLAQAGRSWKKSQNASLIHITALKYTINKMMLFSTNKIKSLLKMSIILNHGTRIATTVISFHDMFSSIIKIQRLSCDWKQQTILVLKNVLTGPDYRWDKFLPQFSNSNHCLI